MIYHASITASYTAHLPAFARSMSAALSEGRKHADEVDQVL